MKGKETGVDINGALKNLSEIVGWFDEQEEVDVEEGLKKVKEAGELIKLSKKRLSEIENEFKEIKANINLEVEEVEIMEGIEEEDAKPEDLPF